MGAAKNYRRLELHWYKLLLKEDFSKSQVFVFLIRTFRGVLVMGFLVMSNREMYLWGWIRTSLPLRSRETSITGDTK